MATTGVSNTGVYSALDRRSASPISIGGPHIAKPRVLRVPTNPALQGPEDIAQADKRWDK
ncbi:hypothetical protein DIPPA_16040 [Diplonema papillatum]|nr:hypothetical protein DIPPA_16040 [Diplonema papillatum]